MTTHAQLLAIAAEALFAAQATIERLAETAEGLGLEDTSAALDDLWIPLSQHRLTWAGQQGITPTGSKMNLYRIHSAQSGHDFGIWQGEDATDALENLAIDAGYDSADDMPGEPTELQVAELDTLDLIMAAMVAHEIDDWTDLPSTGDAPPVDSGWPWWAYDGQRAIVGTCSRELEIVDYSHFTDAHLGKP